MQSADPISLVLQQKTDIYEDSRNTSGIYYYPKSLSKNYLYFFESQTLFLFRKITKVTNFRLMTTDTHYKIKENISSM